MKMLVDQKPSLDDALVHAGVKGMKWGVRKSKHTSSEIHGARSRQDARLRELQRLDDTVETSTGKARASARKKAEQIARDFQTNEDRVTAAKITTGEKFAQAILLGPIALVTIPAGSIRAKQEAKNTDRARELLSKKK